MYEISLGCATSVFSCWPLEHLRAKCLGQGHIAAGLLNEERSVWCGGVHTKYRHADGREKSSPEVDTDALSRS